jgi:cytochrome P450
LASLVPDPLRGMRRLHDAHGPFVLLQYPFSRRSQAAVLPCVADAGLCRAILSAPDVWRNVNVVFRGLLRKNHAGDRLSFGMTRLRGARHDHYRRLIAGPMRRPAVAAMSPQMAAIAQRLVASWPSDVPTDLLPLTENLILELAFGLLFGEDRERALPIARMNARAFNSSWLFPTWNYLVFLAKAAKHERAILEWAEQKRGKYDANDILSVLANNPNECGVYAPELIGGIVTFTFGAAYDTCKSALAWTLILLAQHPTIAGMLADEINGALHGELPTIDRIGALPLLDAVIQEGMRLFPPVPMLGRRSLVDTALDETEIKPKTLVLISGFLINRNPDLYRKPDRFDPERWNGRAPSPYNYATFGAGPHMCPGVTFAHQAMKIAIAAILSRYRIHLVRDTRIDYRIYVSMKPYPAIPVVLRDLASKPEAARIGGRIHRMVDLAHAS